MSPYCAILNRRRMPQVFDHGSNLKLVSAAGLAPAVPRFQAEHVDATPRADFPNELRSSRWGQGNRKTANLGNGPWVRIINWRSRWDLHPHSSRRQRVAFLFSYESEMVGSAGNAPVRHFRLCFATPDLQSGSRITSLVGSAQAVVAGVGVTPT